MDIESIKIISAICSIAGSSILALRVTGILKALSIVAQAHEFNINAHSSVQKNSDRALIQLKNSTEHVEKAQKLPLLISGFLLIILAAILQLIALIMQNGWFNE
ncbi:hypothetical protein [Candidatus Thiodiazotropha sp. CDECU1]|uniref:hypothetical protein n=1 Tax=Candidatus Thiodiazotropha sp. CDECU1 TaxID=3065865 RepID=UPI0029304662|nr:hypothetical protein [Candidatus Thiodiazotropha sp. CDECU1]